MATTKKRKPPKHQRRTASRRHNPIRQKPDNQDEVNGPPPPPPGTPPPGPGGEPGGSNELGIPGLPPDIAAKIDQIFRQYPDNATQRAISYLMSTPWFAQNYAGYAAGLAKSLFSDPFSGGLAQYRAYKNAANNSFRQHYGQDISNDQLINLLNQGFDTQRIEQMGQGYTIQQTQQGDWQYLSGAFGGEALNDIEKAAYGQELAGIDTPLGARIKAKLDAALQRYQGVFQGQLGSSGLQDQQLGQRLQKPKDIQA